MSTKRILGLSSVVLLSMTSFGAPDDAVPFEERVAQWSHNPQEPQTLGEISGFISDVFGVPFAFESLPEDCVGATISVERFPPFAIAREETFRDAISRFEAVSQYRYKFEEIRGVPVLRRNPDVVAEPNLLDTVVSLSVKEVTMWEALCALAREINGKNMIEGGGGKALYIWPSGPDCLEFPAPIFVKEPVVTLALEGVSAREALCAILESAGSTFNYYYTCRQDCDYMKILAWGNGEVVAGRRMVNTAADKEYMEYWETANISKLQLPPGPGAPNASASPPPTPPIETPGPVTKPAEKGSTQDHTTDHTPAPTGSNWTPVVVSGCAVVLAAACVIALRRRFLRKR
jgi:hypothetical protein